MARQIVWTAHAEKDRKRILSYWLRRNGSPSFSLKLLDRFEAATRKLIRHPYVGRPSDIEGIRVLVLGEYLLFYEVMADAIVIHHIWDGRRDLSKLKF